MSGLEFKVLEQLVVDTTDVLEICRFIECYDAAMIYFRRTHPIRQGLTPSYVTERLIEYMEREYNYRRK